MSDITDNPLRRHLVQTLLHLGTVTRNWSADAARDQLSAIEDGRHNMDDPLTGHERVVFACLGDCLQAIEAVKEGQAHLILRSGGTAVLFQWPAKGETSPSAHLMITTAVERALNGKWSDA